MRRAVGCGPCTLWIYAVFGEPETTPKNEDHKAKIGGKRIGMGGKKHKSKEKKKKKGKKK